MAIKAPGWCSHAVPTHRGWEDPQTGELFVSSGFTQEQIDEFHGVAPVVEQVVHEEPAMLHEAPVQGDLESMTKVQLEALGRQHGYEVDRREKKSTIVEKVKKLLD